MSFNVEKETKYDDLEHCFYLDIYKEAEVLVIDAEIVTSDNYKTSVITRDFVCDTISHDDAIRLRDYLNEQYPKDEVQNDK